MSTSLAIATASNSAAILAQQQAERAARVACEAMMPAYTHHGASVDQMRVYAECVDKLYPLPMATGDTIALKIAVVFLFVGVIVGAWKERNSWDGPIMGAFTGFVGVLIFEVVIFMIVAALFFLFS